MQRINIPGNYQAMVQHLFGNVAISARPFDKTDLRASYTIDDRKNDSSQVVIPAAFYGMVTADTVGTTVSGGSNHVPFTSLPVSMLNQTARLDAGYMLMPGTKFSVNYSFSDKQRDYSVTDRNKESILGARLGTAIFDDASGALTLSHAVRTADSYNANSAWLASTYGASNMPGSGMYYLAARTRDEAKSTVSADLGHDLSGGLTFKFYNDHYPDSFFGVTNDYKVAGGPDLTYSPSKDLSLALYYTYEEIFTDQKFSSTNVATAAHTNWTLANRDSVHTLGAKADWQASDTLKLTLSDDLSYGATAFDEGYALIASSTGAPQTQSPTNLVTALPDSKTILNSLNLRGEYKLRDDLSILGGYAYERSVAKDYLYGQAAGSPANGPNISSLPGDGNPSYAIHVVTMSVRLRW
jgi:MtrB/PioB family decaheme-associated outer membrane protein